jgi:hypothetical protein
VESGVSASSFCGVVERPNDSDHRRRANGVQNATGALSPRSVHPLVERSRFAE